MIAKCNSAASEAVDLLNDLAMLNRDDGERFTDVQRLEAIARALEGAPYSRLNS